MGKLRIGTQKLFNRTEMSAKSRAAIILNGSRSAVSLLVGSILDLDSP